jgi:hypothetical protein
MYELVLGKWVNKRKEARIYFNGRCIHTVIGYENESIVDLERRTLDLIRVFIRPVETKADK